MKHNLVFTADQDFHASGSGPTFLSAFVSLVEEINLCLGDPLTDETVREIMEHALVAADADTNVAHRTDFSTPEDNFTIEYITFPDHDDNTQHNTTK